MRAFLESRIAELAPTSLVIVSGMARGIDSVAHASALRAGLPTVGILGTGLDLAYPKESLPLRSLILKQGGLLVSEFPPGTRGFQSNFLQRNRLIAGWTQATWVVEASYRSGALNTAHWAREQNRTCFAVPSFPGDPTLSGNQTLLDRDHALPFWGVHSLGASWLELATGTQSLNPKSSPTQDHPQIDLLRGTDAEALCLKVKQMTHIQGGVQIPEILNWALTGGWKPEQFFVALDLSLKSKRIRDFFGTLVST
jgi:predicted Rossmann fold nucleotide-binding protein DprA/Smf involved in DNA uptake